MEVEQGGVAARVAGSRWSGEVEWKIHYIYIYIYWALIYSGQRQPLWDTNELLN